MLATCVYASFVVLRTSALAFILTLIPPNKKANSPVATFAGCSLYARARILKTRLAPSFCYTIPKSNYEQAHFVLWNDIADK